MASVSRLQDTSPPQHDVTATNIAEAVSEFGHFLPPDAITRDADQCHARASTPWTPVPPSQRPAAVVLPRTTADVSAIMTICSARRIPVTGFCGGTNLPGALVSTRGGVCVDFARMDEVVALHEDDMDVVVQPGVGWQELKEVLAPKGLFFPPDPSPGARIGGMIAMSCSGTNTYRHGTMKEWVIALTAVLADGTIIRTRKRPRKSSAGYDLTRLMIGSEGTLALVTEAVLKLAPSPKNQHVAIATFVDIHAAVRTGLMLVRAGLLIDAIELLDENSMRAVNRSRLSVKTWDERTTLFLKFSGAPQTVNEYINAAKQAAERNDCSTFDVSDDAETIKVWWNARKDAGKAFLSLKEDPSDVFIPSDAAVPISRLADLMIESQKLLAAAEMNGSVIGHIGDGNIHVVIVCATDVQDRAYRIIRDIQDMALDMDGTITGEHGIGMSLRDQLINELGDGAVDLMRRIKLALDPSCILNCDKVIQVDPTTVFY